MFNATGVGNSKSNMENIEWKDLESCLNVHDCSLVDVSNMTQSKPAMHSMPRVIQDIILRQGDPVSLLRAYFIGCWRSLRAISTWRFLSAIYPRLPKSMPVFLKTNKVPCVSRLSQHRILAIYAFTPIIFQQAFLRITSFKTFNASFAFLLYFYTY